VNIRNRVKELRYVPASQLQPNPKNWRKHPEAQANALRGVLAEVGIASAVLARETPEGGLMLIDGHLRTETLHNAEIPVLVLDVSEEEADKILATFDPLGAMAESDADALRALLEDVETGSQELADMLTALAEDAGILDGEDAAEIVEDEIPEPPVDPITKPGDLWLLGEHRLLCGDSTKAEDVERLMAGAKADMVLSDPPYGVSYVGKTKDALKVENDALGEEDLTALVVAAFDNAEANCRAGAYWYATVPPGPLHILFADDWKRRGILRQIMVWAKDSMVLGHSEYHYQHEPILFGWMPGDRHKNSDRTRTTLWQYDRPKANREHPTMKPVALWAQAVTDGSRQGEIVYDPFLGSGTTLIAAEQLGRKCYGMEISPQYCDVIVKRWETLTGRQAERRESDDQASR
jgi:DNA modification methylase